MKARDGRKLDKTSAHLKTQPGDTAPLLDRTDRGGNIGRLLMVGLVLLGIVGAFLVVPERYAEAMTLALLAILSMLGVFFVFALSIGFIRLTARENGEVFSRAFVEGLEQGAIVTDWDGRIVYANKAYGRLTGAGDEDNVETVERVFSRSDEAAEIVYRMNQTVRSGKATTEEFRMVRDVRDLHDDQRPYAPHWYRATVRPLAHPQYSKPLIVWEVADVTQDRQRQESVFVELQHAIDYLDHAPAGFFSADPDGRLVYLNATLADWVGIDLTQFEPGAMRVSDLIVGDGAALLERVDVEPGTSKTIVVDLDLTRSSGKAFAARLYHKVPFAPDGAPGATRTLVLSRQAGAASDDELRAAEVRFTRFFNNTPIAIASFDADGMMMQSNAPFQRLFAPVMAHAKTKDGVNIEHLCARDDAVAMATAMASANEGRAEIPYVDSILPGVTSQIADEECSVRFFVSTVSDGAAAVAGERSERAILYAIEMTEQKALERQMAQGQKMQAIGQLAGGIAHDFNNVLTAIIGFSDLLLANHRPSDPSFQDIMNIKQNANRAATLVRQLLAFSRKQTLRPQTLSVPDVLSDLRMLLTRLMGEKVSLDINHGRDLWPVRADLGQFEQVLVNLCVNARDAINDAGKDGGSVTITTHNVEADQLGRSFARKDVPDADYVVVEVADTGTGMSAEVMEKIFDPFFSTKEVGKGTGLGLSTVYGIIKQSGGFIYADSEQGKGTTFRILLPRHEPTDTEVAELAAENQQKVEKPRDLAGSATILFVEDEDAVRAVGARTLANRGYTVHEAENGEEALELFEELGETIDLIVSDVVMPEMDGPSLLNAVRKSGSRVPFIFASGYAEDAFEKNLPAAEHGKFGFLPKPYSLKHLATAVKEALEDGDR